MLSRIGRTRSLAVLLGAGVCLAGLLGVVVTRDPETGPAAPQGTRGLAGIPAELKTQPPLVLPIRSTEGRRIDPATRDELGYRLPLDVLHPGGAEKPPASSRHSETDESSPEGRRIDADESLSEGRHPGTNLSPSDGRGPDDSSPPHDASGSRRGAPIEDQRLGPDDGHTENETSIDAAGNTIIAGWNQYVASTLVMGLGRSTDGGETWTSGTLQGHTVMSDPAVKSAGAGVWFYGYLASGGFGGSDIDIFVRRSTDDGATWSNPVDASQNGSFDDKPYIAARGSEVLVGWADFGFSPAKVRASRSLDGGLTYGAISILSDNSTAGNGACPVIAPDGDYFVFWRDSFQDSLWVARSSTDGASWSPDRGIVEMHPLPSTLPGGFRIVNLPSAAADPLTGDLVVVWNDQLFGNPDILAIRSSDDGATWSAPVRVNDDAGTAAQWFPWLSFGPDGVAHVVWYDRRNDASAIDVYCASSFDGGMTFEANVRVTAESFPVVLPHDTTIDFIGDYNGIASNATTVFPFYQDSRRGEQDVYVARIPLDVTGVPGDEGVGDAAVAADARVVLRAEPNPFRESVRIGASGAGSASGSGAGVPGRSGRSGDLGALRIVDATGRAVRTLESPVGDGFTWDGRDGSGALVPAGVYFARLTDPSGAGGAGIRLVRIE